MLVQQDKHSKTTRFLKCWKMLDKSGQIDKLNGLGEVSREGHLIELKSNSPVKNYKQIIC